MASFIKPREENSISDSLQEALIYLNKQTIEEGKIYSRRYYSNSSKKSVDVVLAVGILPGVGPSCYSIISDTKKLVVWGISDSLPDVSDVTLGRLYIYWEPNSGKSYIVYLSQGNRIVDPISSPLIVHNSEDTHLYYVSKDSIIDIYEHLENVFSFDDRINKLEQQLKDLLNNGVIINPTPTPPPSFPEEDEETTTTTPPPSVNLVISSFKSLVGSEFEVGESVNVKLSWSYNIPVSYQKINGVELDPSLREVEYSGIMEDTTFTLEARSEGTLTKTKSTTIKFSPMSFIGADGVVELSEITSENFYELFESFDLKESGLSNIMCVGKMTKTFTFDERGSLFLAFPKEIANKLTIIDSSLNSPVNLTKQNLTVTNKFNEEIVYTVYESPAVYAPGTTITWIFNFN